MWRLGIDLGGTKTVLVVGDRQGRVRARRRYATSPTGDPDRDLARLLGAVRELLTEAGIDPSRPASEGLEAVGVAAPGPIDYASGSVVAPPNLAGWERVALREVFRDALGVPVHVDNDANGAVLAEWCYGAAQGARDAVYLTMSTGVGAGLVLGGRLHRGIAGNAGEFGHVAIERDGRLCACGQRGCLEAYVGGAAWAKRLREQTPEDSACIALAGERERLTPEHVIAAARAGDAFASAEVEAYVGHLCEGLAQVIYSLGPQVIVLGTIVTAAADLMLAPLQRSLAQRVWPLLLEGVTVVPAALGERLPELAALCVAFERGDAEGDR